MRLRSLALALAATAAAALTLAGPADAAAPGVRGDFNGDGFDDLAIGVVGEDLGSSGDGGAVNVVYGTNSRLNASGDQMWHQDVGTIEGNVEPGDQFGGAVAVGDFDDDGFDDLAVGAPGEDVGNKADAGAVNVIYGTQSGLNAAADQLWHQDIGTIGGVAEADDRFGARLAVGDFNDDGIADLAVGAPSEDVGAAANAGAVNVIFGSRGNGLRQAGNQLWHQDVAEVEETADAHDRFSAALTAGDFDNQDGDDLAIGVPFEDVAAFADAGAVNVLYSTESGLTAAGDQLFTQDTGTVGDTAEANDTFGSALAAGDLNNDQRDDLAVGVPGEDVVAIADAGAVNVLYGTDTVGLAEAGNQLWTQDSADIEETAEAGDAFGSALVSADFNNNNFDDLAVGVPSEDEGAGNTGGANVIYGSGTGLTSAADQYISQGTTGVHGAPEAEDQAGFVLRAGDFDGSGGEDLAILVPLEDVGSRANAGAVNVLYSANVTGITTSGNQLWTQDTQGIEGGAETDDRFGSA